MQPPAIATPAGHPGEAECRCTFGAPDQEHDVEFTEWHTLLLAVRTRLREVLDAWPMPADTAAQQATAARSRVIALDCADALDQLHDTLIGHGHRYRRVCFDLREARAELALHVKRG